ncbi:MAG: PAS domain-containing protein [Deltaproteobacteria bacterium]|nr:PAS domain-containing protein [Deltaproteobacteria bacterium]
MKKSVAFSPVPDEPGRFWSVAAVVPAAEVARTVRSTYVRQLFVQAVLVLALLFAGLALVWHERRWSRELEARVMRATSDLMGTNASLRRAEEKYRSVVDSVREVIVVVGADGRIQAINRFAVTALGAEAADLWGRPVADLLRPADAQALLAHVHQALDRGRSLDAHLTIRVRGRDRQLAGHFVPLPEEGPADRVLLVAHDVEEHHRLEEVMYRTEKLASLGRLAAGVGHEINNPIAVILGFTEVLLEAAPEGSEQREILKRVERQGLACKRIVENLLAFAHLPQQGGDRTDVNQDVRAILEILDHALKTRRIDLRLELAEGLPPTRADSGQLQQVFMNLTNNAMAAMPDGGALAVSTRLGPLSKLVEVAFADSGCGIRREHADKVFEPFFPTKQVGEGTGLGLSVSHAIVAKFGGTISFETRTAGDPGGPPGTTFLVSLLPAPEKTAGGPARAR